MKWIWSTAVVVVAVSSAAGAQSGKDGDKSMMGDKMNMTYTGCVEVVNHGGMFLLTHLSQGHEKAMKDDMTTKKDMGSMKADGPSDWNGMSGDHMMPRTLALTGSPDLKKHVGQKVSVTGTVSKGVAGTMRHDLDTLTVGVLKVVDKSCS